MAQIIKMKTALFDYTLPEELIASSPVSPRDHSKLMIINRSNKQITHKHFFDLPDLLNKNDVLVLNETKVFPARIYGRKESGGKVEILLNKNIDQNTWQALAKPGLTVGTNIIFDGFSAVITGRDDEIHEIKFELDKNSLLEKLQTVGVTPLPPYIHSNESESEVRKEYQTTYAKTLGSVAAPTAGFHFTKDLLDKIKGKGIEIEYVTLHVGLGTFAPVKTETLEEHKMHSEDFFVSKETIERLNNAKKNGKRIISVGTTSTRVLESISDENSVLNQNKLNGSTNIFIYPPYKFKFVDSLITNFHLPKSTLLALISALVSSPNTDDNFTDFENSLVGKAYTEAIKNKYRFYSFGDSSIIL